MFRLTANAVHHTSKARQQEFKQLLMSHPQSGGREQWTPDGQLHPPQCRVSAREQCCQQERPLQASMNKIKTAPPEAAQRHMEVIQCFFRVWPLESLDGGWGSNSQTSSLLSNQNPQRLRVFIQETQCNCFCIRIPAY